eukprot:CAMPEP_0174917386 /NCGR_PEP_ID=MMETSP1355-20121228/2418_1 /TAXON_ID=464990 /ORGANISM="Hemiselmis tepida, Strain CCMP443" /LENGTH=180 /DNA_ID=CAMNT_0016162467 /DNA_START=132 /DNA_END=670 /DNA_ORIENTATION=+
MGFNTGMIGYALLGQGVILVCHILFFFPHLKRFFGPLGIFRICGYLCPFVCLFTPGLGDIQPFVSPFVLWAAIYLYMLVKAFAFSSGFTSVSLLVNNSAPKRVIGSINGMSQTCASLASAVAPAFAGNLFSLSLQMGRPWPFDHHLVFYVVGAVSAVMLFMSFLLPESLQQRYDESQEEP